MGNCPPDLRSCLSHLALLRTRTYAGAIFISSESTHAQTHTQTHRHTGLCFSHTHLENVHVGGAVEAGNALRAFDAAASICQVLWPDTLQVCH